MFPDKRAIRALERVRGRSTRARRRYNAALVGGGARGATGDTDVVIVDVCGKDEGTVRNIVTQVVYNYPDSFYTRRRNNPITYPESLSKLALWRGVPVGVILCNVEPVAEPVAGGAGYNQVYVGALGVLEKHRLKGIARMLMAAVVRAATGDALRHLRISGIRLNVQESNAAALSFYAKMGFVHEQTLPLYYLGTFPDSPGCRVLTMPFVHRVPMTQPTQPV